MRPLLPLLVLLTACPRSDLDVRTAPKVDLPTDTGDSGDPPTTDTGTPVTTDSDEPLPAGGDPFDPIPAPPVLSAGALSAIAGDIDDIRDSTVASTGVYVVDLENGQVVYAHDEDRGMKPASNTKLFTTGLAFDELGEDHRLDVTAWGDANPSGAGVVDTVTVVSEHDFTWSTEFYEADTFPAERLADRLWDAGVRSVSELVVAGDYLVEGYQFGYYDSATHRGLAEDVLFVALEDRGISVGDTRTTSSFARPAGSVSLAVRGSPPLSVAAHPLNVYSHNEFADVLARHNGFELGAASSYDEGAAAVESWLSGVGIDTAGFELHDGSGLSHDNRVTPRQVGEMLRYLVERPSGTAWVRTFSIGNVIGTLGARMGDGDIAGRFYGKSGTLTGVIATSGVLFHAHDGHRYAISALMNDVVDDTFARSLEDDIVAAVGADRRALGDRPERPELQEVRSLGDGRLSIEWDDQASADDWDLWLSVDGASWDRADGRRVSGVTRHVAAGLDLDRTWCVRLVASNAAGWSDPSDVLCARTSETPPQVLVVNGDDRWQAQWENPTGRGHDFVVPYAVALGDVPFDSVDHTVVRNGGVELRDYELVVWQLGEESSDDQTFDDVEQDVVRAAFDDGVNLFVSGAEVGWDLDWLGSGTDQSFFSEVLGGSYVGDASESYTVEPVNGGWFQDLGELGFYTPGTQEVLFADRLDPAPGGEAALRYVGGLGGTAAVVREGPADVVLFGFPFESIDTADQRAAVLSRVLDHTLR